MRLSNYTWVSVDSGDFFEGSFYHWADCFFSNPSVEDIVDFCGKRGCKTVKFFTEVPAEFADDNKDLPKIPLGKWHAKSDDELEKILCVCLGTHKT
jgi:hypothetical protein